MIRIDGRRCSPGCLARRLPGIALIAALLLLADSVNAGADLPGDPRRPAVCPDGSRIVFDWNGDLWEAPITGGVPRCLTPGGRGYDHGAMISPDGLWIAFTSDRAGEDDVYLMPSGGGEATRLTWYGGWDEALAWSPEGDSVYFLSDRELSSGWVFAVATTGGTPGLRIPVTTNGMAISPDAVVVERGFTPWWRRHYRGSASRDLWLVLSGERTWRPLADSPLDERFPLWSPRTDAFLFVREDSSGNANIWSVRLRERAVQETFLADGDISFPSISADGGTIVFEHGGALYRTGVPSFDEPRAIPLELGFDLPVETDIRLRVGSRTSQFDVSDDGRLVVLAAFGELYAGRLAEHGGMEEVSRLTFTAAREYDPELSPDGTEIAASSEWGGEVSLVILRPAGGERFLDDDGQPRGFLSPVAPASTVPVLGSDVATDPHWSPDGGRIAYLDRDDRLRVYDTATRDDRAVCGTAGILHHSWSPDGRWIAFSVPDMGHKEDIFVVPSGGGGQPENVSLHANDDFQPFWPPDGRRLIFASRTDEGEYHIRQLWLTEEDFRADEDEREKLLDDPVGTVRLEIQSGIQNRVETLCTVEGYYDFYGASPDGRSFAFMAYDVDGDADLWRVDWKGEGLQRITHGDQEPWNIRFTESGDILYLTGDEGLRMATADGGSRMLSWASEFTADLRDLQLQKFDEAWRLLRDRFYDEGMHGYDWDTIRERYRERAASCLENEDFNDVVRRMLGELSASHLGIYGPWRSGGSSGHTGELGIVPDHRSRGGRGILVDSVIPGSPADLDRSAILAGDRILRIDGTDVGPSDNLYRPLIGTAGREILVEVLRRGVTVEVVIEPAWHWDMWRLLYDEWIERNRRTVARLSEDRAGYLHIASMNQRSVERFMNDLFAEGLYRDAMIVDVRDNGGGSTHDQILSVLGRPEYAYSLDRSGQLTAQPLGVWSKPVVLIINERCYSDAEIFPAGWKALGIGPVVGNTTYGAVIGTVDVDLIDGTGFRVPGTGWYTSDWRNLENTGVEPDIFVLELPGDAALGVDRQLEKAVEVVLDILEEADREEREPG